MTASCRVQKQQRRNHVVQLGCQEDLSASVMRGTVLLLGVLLGVVLGVVPCGLLAGTS